MLLTQEFPFIKFILKIKDAQEHVSIKVLITICHGENLEAT